MSWMSSSLTFIVFSNRSTPKLKVCGIFKLRYVSLSIIITANNKPVLFFVYSTFIVYVILFNV